MQIHRCPPTDPNPGSCPWASRQEFRMKMNREQSRLFFCADAKIGDSGELRRLGSFCQANLNQWNRARRCVGSMLCGDPHIRAIVQGPVDGPRRGSFCAPRRSSRYYLDPRMWNIGPNTGREAASATLKYAEQQRLGSAFGDPGVPGYIANRLIRRIRNVVD